MLINQMFTWCFTNQKCQLNPTWRRNAELYPGKHRRSVATRRQARGGASARHPQDVEAAEPPGGGEAGIGVPPEMGMSRERQGVREIRSAIGRPGSTKKAASQAAFLCSLRESKI